MAALSDYKFTGYGIISQGSSVKMFMGTDQQFFLGGKNAMTIGTSNTFTAGIKADVMVGPAVNMSLGPDWNKAVGDAGKGGFFFGGALTAGHLFAKYDFSTNKNFAFHIAHEGSSNYVTQSKFMCTTGFLAVGGFQPAGEAVYKTYTNTIHGMGKWAALTNFLMAFTQIAQTIEAPAPKDEKDKGELKNDNTRQLWAKIIPGVVAGASSSIILSQAILAAIQRESNFKSFLHPQSVIDLTKTSVFLGALGDTLQVNQRDGASLKLADGKATLGVRRLTILNKANARNLVPFGTPYTEKFTDFNDTPTAALEIDSKTVTSYASRISIAAGAEIGTDPMSRQWEAANKALQSALKASKAAGDKAYDIIFKNIFFAGTDEERGMAASIARDKALLAASPAIATAITAYMAALAYVESNPTLYLTAGSKTKSPLAKIEAEAPNFNVISPSISLSDTRIPLRGLFVKQVPPSIQLVQSAVSKISMDTTGSIALAVNPSVSINLKPSSVVIQLGPNSISMKPVVTTITAGAQKIELGMGVVKIGSSLKVMGV